MFAAVKTQLTSKIWPTLVHRVFKCSLSKSNRSRSALKMIEIERKFVIPANCEEKLLSLGAQKLGQKSLRDLYYDNEKYLLTLADHWLRQRDGIWQLKCPPDSREKDLRTAQYVEISEESDVLRKISTVLENSNSPELSLSEYVNKFCKQFAVFVTDRKSYSLDNCTIDLDLTDFDFCVGEIEVMVNSEEEVPSVLKRIDELASKLGIQYEKRVPGKLDAYIIQTNPEHHEQLVKAKIFGDVYSV